MSGREIDDALVDGIRGRSDEAFTTVYRLIASDLVSFANGMLRDRGAAEDAVQQAFLELTRAAPSLEGDGRSLRAWLYRSVRFSCLDELRRRRRHPEAATDPLPERSVGGEPDLPDPALQEALMALEERQRAIILLRHVVGCSVDEIAEIVGSNRTAVYAASARAERRLRKLLQTVESGPGSASQPVDGPRASEERP